MRHFCTLLLAATAAACFAASAPAAVVLSLDTEFSGASEPEGTSPWLTATIENAGTDMVTITMSAANLVGTEFVSQWLFNLDPSKSISSIDYVSGQAAVNGATFSVDAYKADGDGYYDLQFDFGLADNSDRLTAGETSVYKITGAGIDENSFSFFDSGGSKGDFQSAAHVQSIQEDQSGWIGAGGDGVIPEPGSLLVWSLLALSVGIFTVRRGRRS